MRLWTHWVHGNSFSQAELSTASPQATAHLASRLTSSRHCLQTHACKGSMERQQELGVINQGTPLHVQK